MTEQEQEQEQQAELQQLEAQLYQEPVLYEWEYTGIGGEHYNWLFQWGMSISICLLGFFLTFAAGDFVWHYIITTSFAVFSLFMTLVSRYLFFPDSTYRYHLTRLGIHYTRKECIPDVAYAIARGISVVGIIVCVLAFTILGPMAFVGAGACALMSFKMTNFQPETKKLEVMIENHTLIFHRNDDSIIAFVPKRKRRNLSYHGLVFTPSIEEKEKILGLIQSLFEDIELVEVKKIDDKYKHPVYNQYQDNNDSA
ncbi:hypothetical protein JCM19233_3951 [Vibrio astriarenae]|nr:hypothetical protein JCM19233_3951 [Vibrio sp. C7]